MKADSLKHNYWYGDLSRENGAAIAQEIRRRFADKLLVVVYDNSANANMEVYSGQAILRCDYSAECIRIVMPDRRFYFEIYSDAAWAVKFDGDKLLMERNPDDDWKLRFVMQVQEQGEKERG